MFYLTLLTLGWSLFAWAICIVMESAFPLYIVCSFYLVSTYWIYSFVSILFVLILFAILQSLYPSLICPCWGLFVLLAWIFLFLSFSSVLLVVWICIVYNGSSLLLFDHRSCIYYALLLWVFWTLFTISVLLKPCCCCIVILWSSSILLGSFAIRFDLLLFVDP